MKLFAADSATTQYSKVKADNLMDKTINHERDLSGLLENMTSIK